MCAAHLNTFSPPWPQPSQTPEPVITISCPLHGNTNNHPNSNRGNKNLDSLGPTGDSQSPN